MPFWNAKPSSATSSEHLIDVTFVDDEAAILLARTPAQLDRSIDIMLFTYASVFAKFMLVINWAPGKSEGMLRYRGNGSRQHLDNRRLDGKIKVPLPKPFEHILLNIVAKYKHLGSIVAMDSNDTYDAKLRSSSAMSAYCPLAAKVFGSCRINLWLKLLFMHALVLTRLLYQVCLWGNKPKPFRLLNCVYMRCLRRIAGDCRFGASDTLSDLQVRQKLVQPSLDCLISRRRLLHARSIATSRSPLLCAMLAQKCDKCPDKVLPWVKLLRRDLHIMYSSQACYEVLSACNNNIHIPHPNHCTCEEHPCACSATWRRLLVHASWKDAVNALFFIESRHDAIAPVSNPTLDIHVCSICAPLGETSKHAFDTAHALASHCRAKHKTKNIMRMYVGDCSTCTCCKTVFGNRLSLIGHLSDSRRPKCRDFVLTHSNTIDPSLCTELDLKDARLRLLAQRDGYSHSLVQIPAKRARL